MTSSEIKIELEPWERAVLLKWNKTPEIQSQLKALATSPNAETITVAPSLVLWIASDLTHAITKRGCRDEDVIDLSQRFDYIHDTGDGRIESWC
jgi:hypothetical protein